MRITRPDINIRTTGGYGKAAALLRSIGQQEFTFFLTLRCNVKCAHCQAPKGRTELDTDLVKDTIDDLTRLPTISFSGGQPSLYKSNPYTYMDLLHYAAPKAGIRIVVYTNGTEFPTELSSAVRYLDEYPNNATFCLSLDRHHREALAQNGFDLKIIFRTLYEACGLSGKRLEFNARVEPEKTGMPLNGLEDIFSSEHQKTSWKAMAFANSVLAQGWAINLPENETKLLSLADFLLHLKKIHPMGLWATSTGLVASSGHAAHLASPPPFAVYGDLNKTTLAKILWESLGGYFVTSGKAKGLSFEEAMVQHAKNFVLVPTDTEKFMKILCDKTETREPPAEEVAAFLANPKVPITWEVDVDDPLPYLSGFSFDPKMLGPNIIPVIKKGRLEFLSKEATKAAEIIPFRPRGLEFQLSDGSRIVFGPIHERSLL